MPVVLIFPPVASSFSGLPAGLAALHPYLAQRGFSSRLLDLNVDLFWFVWGNWPRIGTSLNDRFAELARRFNGNTAACRFFQQHLRLTLPLLDRIHGEQSSPDKWDKAAARLLQRSVAAVINAFFLEDLLTNAEHLTVSMDRLSAQVRKRASDNLLEEFLSQYDWKDVELVGFSLVTETQLPYAMLIAMALRSAQPGIRIVAGGPYITEVVEGLCSDPATFEYFDFLVVHEGESALAHIAGRPGAHVNHPNVVCPGHFRRRDSFLVEDIESLPDQDFSQFNLDRYRPWGLNLPLYSSKGCSWGHCAFCSVNFLRYRERDAGRFYESAVRAVRCTGVSNVQLVDEDVRPERLHRLADLARGTPEPPIQWMIQTRFYRGLDRELLCQLARSGFSTIEFGLESSSEQTLKMIKKGISIPMVRRILADCEQAGIKVVLNFMVGFPWEIEADALKSLEFVDEIARQHPALDLVCNTQSVKVYVHSEFHQSADRYGVTSSRALMLSPITTWEPPEWVASFIRRHGYRLLFSGCSSRPARSTIPAAAVSTDPLVSLAPGWYFLPTTPLSVSVPEWARPLLVKASDNDCEPMAVSETLAAILREVERRCRVSELKSRFRNCFLEFEEAEVFRTLGDGLLKLNGMGALAFHAD
ncbi:MAG: B12-binding domain-containing radical SAM protein [Candidatus Omnitrophica bacterium]|nr:B12-binding domain-containing radical SAM protein [Candidatus Omnitrophota bacterium]